MAMIHLFRSFSCGGPGNVKDWTLLPFFPDKQPGTQQIVMMGLLKFFTKFTILDSLLGPLS